MKDCIFLYLMVYHGHYAFYYFSLQSEKFYVCLQVFSRGIPQLLNLGPVFLILCQKTGNHFLDTI